MDYKDIVAKYLDGKLADAEMSEFEAELRRHEAAREALIEELSERAMADLRGDAPETAECEGMKALMRRYAEDDLDAAEKGVFARHVDRCAWCTIRLHGEMYGNEGERPWRTALLLVVILAVVAAAVVLMRGVQ